MMQVSSYPEAAVAEAGTATARTAVTAADSVRTTVSRTTPAGNTSARAGIRVRTDGETSQHRTDGETSQHRTDGTASQSGNRPHADSLSRVADSLRTSDDTLAGPGADASFRFSRIDSIRFGWSCEAPTCADTTQMPWRDTSATALFGSQSITVQPQNLERPVGDSLTDNAVFQGFVLLLAATYATLLYRNLGDVRLLLTRISRDSTSGKRFAEEPGVSGFSRFLNITTAIGMLFMGVIVVKYGDTLMPPELGHALSHAAVLALSLLATLAWAVIILFQSAAIRIAGAITLSQPFIAQLALLRRTYFALAVIISSPTLLLFALCPRGTGGAWFIISAVELIITAVLYLRESLNLFISKKISILHWFLYLCTVEVFPISLLWLLAAR